MKLGRNDAHHWKDKNNHGLGICIKKQNTFRISSKIFFVYFFFFSILYSFFSFLLFFSSLFVTMSSRMNPTASSCALLYGLST